MGEEIKQELKLGDAESSTYALLNQLADGDTDITINVDSNEVISKTKMFLVLSAQKQLKRILKQTAFLEKLESARTKLNIPQRKNIFNNKTMIN